MPYEDVDIECDIFLCSHNESSTCGCECHTDELNPNKKDCSKFQFIPGCFDVTVHKMKIEDMMELIKQEEISFISLDEESPRFQTVVASSGEYCLVQGSDDFIKQFHFWKHVDGGFGYTDKDQLELFSKEG